MRQLAIGIIMLDVSLKITGLYTIIECPTRNNFKFHSLRHDVTEYSHSEPLRISCTMQLSCPPMQKETTSYKDSNQDYQVYEYPEAVAMCEVKLKINIVRNLTVSKTRGENPCANFAHRKHLTLLPHSTNCSLFYKCDWGMPILFECPENLHFNPVLQLCDWPWQAGCDSSWISCPRPFPQCPAQYSNSLLLPHPFLCDRFYQCDWGTPQLRACPTGLHFDPHLKMCDWPYNSDCRSC